MAISDIERRYAAGDIIFHEGQRARDAYLIVHGQVELLKTRPGGRVRLALLAAGQIFGEMGIVNRAVRSATARAVGDVVLEVVDREGFLETLRDRPETALKLIGSLSNRLRATNDMITPARSTDARGKGRSIWDLVDALMARRRAANRVLEVRIAPLFGDARGTVGERLATGLALNKSVHTKPIPAPAWSQIKGFEASDIAGAAALGRQILVRENADLVIWGALSEFGTIQLRFISRNPDGDHPGAFLLTDRLVLPAGFAPDYGRLLVAVSVAATNPRGDAHRRWLESLLTKALADSQDSAAQPPIDLALADRATIQACYANVAATIGHHLGDSSWYRQAAEAYDEALGNIRAELTPLDHATVTYHLARVRHYIGERSRDVDILESAIAGFRTACETLTQESFPWEWATMQACLGAAHYKIDSIRSDTEILKQSVACYQSALLVFTRSDAPLRWSDAKNGLGLALQMWGDMARNVELLQRAVQCCQESLQVRTREETPLLWAASQNNVGSALYLLGRMTEDSEHLEGSAEAFGKALEIYLAYGLARLSKITERNLMKAEDMLRARLARRVARVYWEDEADEERAERLERQRRTARVPEL